MFSVTGAMLWIYIVRCKRDKIAQVLSCLLTSALGSCQSIPEIYAVDLLLYKTSCNNNTLYTHSNDHSYANNNDVNTRPVNNT